MRLNLVRFIAKLFVAMALVVTPLAFVLADGAVSSAQAQTVRSIEVVGNQRINRDTVLTYVTIDPGTRATPVKIDETIQALFATGFFSDVSIDTRGGVLVISLQEAPLVNGVAFLGNKKLDDEQILGAVQTKVRGVFSEDQVGIDAQRIKIAYESIGLFNVTVKSKIEPLDNNRVNVIFRIDETEKTGIARINFVGNENFGDARLRAAISTRQTGLLSFLRSDDIYDQTRLAADEEQLRRFYFNEGYADFDVISSVVDFDEKKNKFFITITISEGPRYKFGQINIDSVLLDVDPESFRPLVTTKEGDVYDARKVEKTIEALTLAASAKGFAFAEVRPRGEQTDDQRINITYAIDQGPRVFVERINIIGNTRTREFIIRREFDIAEGDAFSQAQLTKTERRLRGLGFFKNVSVSRAQGSAPDRVVINVTVEEESTGDLSFGVGADLFGGFLTDFSITERNFLGRAQTISATAGVGTNNRTLQLSFTEPFFLGRRISAGFDLFRRDSDNQQSRSFEVSNTGGSLRLGFPLAESLALGFRYTYDRESLDDITEFAPIIIQIADPITNTSSITYSLVYSSLDNPRDPKDGQRVSFEQEFAGLGGDVAFIKSELAAVSFHELNAKREVVGLLRGRAGNISGLGQSVGILDNFFGGGDLVRGFDTRGIGPRESGEILSAFGATATGIDAVGGTNFFSATAQVTFPAPLIPRQLGIKTSLFADAGSVFGFEDVDGVSLEEGSNEFSVRSSVGVGITWNSPFGPLSGDFAYVITSEEFDDTQVFRIGGGTRF